MIQDLAFGHELIIKDLKVAIKVAQDEGDEATADIFIGRIQAHEKATWMLVSSQ